MEKGQALFLVIMVILVALDLRNKPKRQSWSCVRDIGWRAAAEGFCLAALTVVVMTFMRQVPILGDSIVDLVWPRQRDGDLSFWNIVSRVGWMSAAFAVLMLINAPHIVAFEERIFRGGTKTWKQALKRSLLFGFMHPLFMPVFPLGFGIMATFAGLWFTRRYFRGGLQASTAFHLATDFWLFGFVIVVWIINVIRG